MIKNAAYWIINGHEHMVVPNDRMRFQIGTRHEINFYSAMGDLLESHEFLPDVPFTIPDFDDMLDPSVEAKPVTWKTVLTRGDFERLPAKYLVFYDKNDYVIRSIKFDGEIQTVVGLDLSGVRPS